MTLKRAAIYVRVSTERQTTENQEQILRKVCVDRGWELQAVYDDTGISGTKTRADRPGLDSLLKDATRGRFDIVLIYKLDRLGRSVIDLHNNAEHLRSCGVDLYCHTQAIDTSTPTGKLTFTILAGVAEFERELIKERIEAGLDRARAQGVKLGRPKVDEAKEAEIRKLLGEGSSIRAAAKAAGVGHLTVQRIKKEMAS